MHEDSRFPLDGRLELLGDDAVVGADCDGGEVDVPDGVVGRGDRGERRLRPPLVVDRRDQHAAQHARRAEQNQPQVPEFRNVRQIYVPINWTFLKILNIKFDWDDAITVLISPLPPGPLPLPNVLYSVDGGSI